MEPNNQNEVLPGDLDEAARIFVRHTTTAMQEMHTKGIDYAAAIQAVIQMSMRAYADLIGDDAEAIQHVRGFLVGWEQDLDVETSEETAVTTLTEEDSKRLMIAAAPFLIEASRNGHSMATVELDPTSLMGLSGNLPGAGRMVIAIAAGSSKDVLKQAIGVVKNAH